MEILVIIGTVLTLAGICLLGYCILSALRTKRADIDDDARRARLQTIVALNMGALAISTLGLMCVIMGVILG